MKSKRSESRDCKIGRWLNAINWEILGERVFLYFMGVCTGVFLMMIQHQHQIISVMEGLQ